VGEQRKEAVMDASMGDLLASARELKGAVGEMKQRSDERIGDLEKRLRALERTDPAGYVPGDRGRLGRQGATGGGGRRGFALWLQNTLLEGDPAKGGVLVPPDQASAVWEMLGAASIGLASGFTIVDTDSDELHLPTVTDDGAAWTPEATAIADAEPTFAEVIARPRKLAAYVEIGNELIDDSSPAALDVVSQSVTRAMGRELDKGFFVGSGTAPEIRGLFNVVGIQTVAGGAVADLDPVVDAIAALEAEDLAATAIYMNPAIWAKFLGLKEATGSIRPLLVDSAGGVAGGVTRSILGVPVFTSSQLPLDKIGVAQADQVVAVRRQEARIETSRDVKFREDVTALRAVSRWDITLPTVKAFVSVEGVTAAAAAGASAKSSK
jgi:HK97 family phage major capsid protein